MPVKFGAKVSISFVNGYVFTDKLDWEAYNEESHLIPAIEAYKEHYGHEHQSQAESSFALFFVLVRMRHPRDVEGMAKVIHHFVGK